MSTLLFPIRRNGLMLNVIYMWLFNPEVGRGRDQSAWTGTFFGRAPGRRRRRGFSARFCNCKPQFFCDRAGGPRGVFCFSFLNVQRSTFNVQALFLSTPKFRARVLPVFFPSTENSIFSFSPPLAPRRSRRKFLRCRHGPLQRPRAADWSTPRSSRPAWR